MSGSGRTIGKTKDVCMYPQQNNGMQMPYDINRPQYQPMQWSMERPPLAPMYRGDQRLVQYVPLVSALLATEITGAAFNAGVNPFKILMFNQMARNNFCNEDFEGLIITVVKYIDLMLNTNQWHFQNLESQIHTAVARITEMARAANLQDYPGMAQFIPPQNQNGVAMLIQNFNALIQANNQYTAVSTQQGMFPQTGFQMPNMGNNQTWAQQSMQNMGNNNGGAQSFIHAQTRQPGTVTNLFTTTGNSTGIDANTGSMSVTGRKYRKAAPAPAPVPEPVQQTNHQAMPKWPTDAQGRDVIGESGLDLTPPAREVEDTVVTAADWKRSDAYPYPPAYNPRTHRVIYKRLSDGTIQPLLDEKESFDMDFYQHDPDNVFGKAPENYPVRYDPNAAAKVLNGVRELNGHIDEIQADPELDKVDYSAVVHNKPIGEISLETAWYLASVYRVRASVDGVVPMVYRAYAMVADPVLSLVNETEVVELFAACDTFTELVDVMNEAYKTTSPELWSVCHSKITAAVNRIVAQDLSIPGLSIDGFTDDILELIDVLGERYGERVLKSFMKAQLSTIKSCFAMLNEEMAETFSSLWSTEDEIFEGSEIKPVVTHVFSEYSLTFINCLSHELDIELNSQVGATVLESTTPTMRLLLEGLFTDVEERERTGDFKFWRHFIRTSDNRILEARRGLIVPEHMLLTLVK